MDRILALPTGADSTPEVEEQIAGLLPRMGRAIREADAAGLVPLPWKTDEEHEACLDALAQRLETGVQELKEHAA